MTKVSIIIAAYNAAGTIGATLETIPAAVSCDYEVLVCDDGSTDDTAAIAARYPHVTVMSGANAGVSTARNRGLAAASGDTIFFLDADDELTPKAIDRLLAAMDEHHVAAYGNYVNITSHGAVIPRPWWVRLLRPSGQVLPQLLLANFIMVGSVLIRHVVLQSLGGFKTYLHFGEDWELWCRVAAAGPIAYVGDEPVLRYRRHTTSATQSMHAVDVVAKRTLEAVFTNPAIVRAVAPARLAFLRRAQEAHMMHLQAIREARLGHNRSAWLMMIKAMFHTPSRALALLTRFLVNARRIR